jgi:hypothetical protein
MISIKETTMASLLTSSAFKKQNQRDLHLGGKEILYNPVNTVTVDIGMVMILLSVLGLFIPNFLGLNLSAMHCWVLAASGCMAVWSGLLIERKMAMKINFAVGIFFALNAIMGWAVGNPGIDHGVMNVSDDFVVKIAPGFLELSTLDHILHSVIAVFFLIEAFSYMYLMRKEKQI